MNARSIFAIVLCLIGFTSLWAQEPQNPPTPASPQEMKYFGMTIFQWCTIIFGAGGIGALIKWMFSKFAAIGAVSRIAEEMKLKLRLAPKVVSPQLKVYLDACTKRIAELRRPAGAGPVRVVVVASGKGGVGKSTVSLGLLEYFSGEGTTVLVDLDMPNRGLTSLFAGRLYPEKNPTDHVWTNTLDELATFLALSAIESSELLQGAGFSKAKSDFEASPPESVATLWKTLNHEYVAMAQNSPDMFKLLRVSDSQALIRANDTQNRVAGRSINPANAWFMPSIKTGDLFLSSPVFRANEFQVFLFFRCLAQRLLLAKGANTIIIDCHGAHDLFMVGAIQAARHLVLSMTPEPGCFDGTFELLSFATQSYAQLAAEKVNATTTVVVNNMAAQHKDVGEELEKFFSEDHPFKPQNIVLVESNQRVRELMGSYEFGKVSETDLWPNICAIGHGILMAEGNNRLPAPKVVAPPQEEERDPTTQSEKHERVRGR